ncbi:hypothetical protein HXX76_007778 [Chlamydomonas incerta]|uniref:S-adenosyl-L-methionine-dependent methyltransferase n=1 Tax=Chlamydomonas incerta TaxID=51695 RepID=A0A835VZV5_CHLIN|nr:hypothetical protein HXX76_007778 [Chlamydomonas incerta]|eukprot:KAG2434050.1 hypothetical protein HXX76_007778 [Chlamydomonas incerta]
MRALRVVSVGVGTIAVVELLRRAVLARWARRKFCGLDSLVSFSACVIAARRAFETELPDAYICDPLAEGLCGKEALEACRKRLAASERKRGDGAGPAAATGAATGTGSASDGTATSSQPAATPATAANGAATTAPQLPATELQAAQDKDAAAGPRPISRLIIRTKFFDDVASIVTWQGAAAAAAVPCHAPLAAVCRAAAACRQVVLLGSGLDSRPWRLALPPGVAWFEVDRRDVLAAKTRRLGEMGAQTRAHSRPPAALQMQPLPGAGNGAVAQQGQQQGQQPQWGQQGYVHPLKAGSWECVAVDLQHRGWSRGLLRAGLDPAQPVCWILEGLLYYLEERDVRALLQEAASASGPGSVLAASIIQAPPALPAASATDSGSPSASSVATPTAAAAAASAAAASPSTSAAPGTPSAAAAAAADMRAPSGGKAGGKDVGKDKGSASWNVRSEFKWRCEGGVPEFLAECGWSALWTESWLQTVQSYGLTPEGASTASGVYFTSAKLV